METKKAKTTVVVCLLTLVGLLGLCQLALAGGLEPSAPPGPTMKTLDEVEPRTPIPGSNTPASTFAITQSGSYYLTGNRLCSGTGIQVDVNDVTIDLMGYTLKGPDSGTKSGVYMNGRSNVEICNGTIRDFGYPGIFEDSSGNSHRVINVRVLSNGNGIELSGYGHLVKDCTAVANVYRGIYASIGCTLIGNICYDNGGDGISTGNSCTLTGNTCYSNGDYGIDTGYGCTVTGNMCYDNSNSGIETSNGCTVTGNTCYSNNNYGIDTGNSCTLTGNTCYGNGDYGIYANVGCTLIGNTAVDNTNYGIYASSYCLVDQNTAYGNGTNMYTGTGCVLGTNCAP